MAELSRFLANLVLYALNCSVWDDLADLGLDKGNNMF